MKASILTLSTLGLVLICSSDCFAVYSREANNGGPNGYNKVSHTVIDGNTRIRCDDSGYEGCPTAAANPSEQSGVDYAYAQIGANVLSGSWLNMTTGLTTTWSAANSAGLDANITVQ